MGGVGAVAAGIAAGATLGKAEVAEAAQEVGPVIGNARLAAAESIRLDMRDRMVDEGIPSLHVNNGDEDRYANRIGSYSKGLPHNNIGEVNPAAFNAFLAALSTGTIDSIETITLGGARGMTNPLAGLAFTTDGNDPHQFIQPPAPAFSSAELAGEMVEHYWQALLRDVHFERYDTHPIAGRAANELTSLEDFKGPMEGGQVTRQTLFRDDLPGCTVGPYISQFLILPTPFGAEFVDRRMRTLAPGSDHMTRFGDWLAVQNGNVPGRAVFDPVRRYIRNGRDLSEWVHIDVLFQAYFNACLIMGTPPDDSDIGGGIGCPVNVGNPYRGRAKQFGFGTWGPPGFKTLLCEVSTRALKAVWFQKWFVHRRLRPEAFAGRVHVARTGQASYPLHGDVGGSEAANRVFRKYGSYLLPMAFPEGSPTHPSYGAGHATVAGACVTILKALFDENFVIPNPKVVSPDGLSLQPYTGPALTVGGELNKVASNVATGRNIAGVHWRSDAYWSLRLGEQVAIALLRDNKLCSVEGGGHTFTTFDGDTITI
ncbi:MAG: vanadium-dependent haloperoxidase [Thermoanaerobaculia bacterium]|nr:vanadium-dependent haloperoxidase [Thermoanaerobaculia bacterium]